MNFITFEGIDGCGKSTQILRIAQWLRSKYGHKQVAVFKEPGTGIEEQEITSIIMNGDYSPVTDLLLFSAARSIHINKIVDALESGKIVLCDRFTDSTIAYQGLDIDIDVLNTINGLACQYIEPSLTLWLDADIAKSLSRIQFKRNPDKFEVKGYSYYDAVSQKYKELYEKNKHRIVRVDGNSNPDEVSYNIMFHIEKLLKSSYPIV